MFVGGFRLNFSGVMLVWRELYLGFFLSWKYLQTDWVTPTTLFWDCWDTVSFFSDKWGTKCVCWCTRTSLIRICFPGGRTTVRNLLCQITSLSQRSLKVKHDWNHLKRYLLTEHHGHDGQNIFIQSCLLPTFVDATQNPSSVYNPSRLFDPHDT